VNRFKDNFKQLNNGYTFNENFIKYYPLKGPFKKISDIKDNNKR